MVKCSNCELLVDINDIHCPYCGMRIVIDEDDDGGYYIIDRKGEK